MQDTGKKEKQNLGIHADSLSLVDIPYGVSGKEKATRIFQTLASLENENSIKAGWLRAAEGNRPSVCAPEACSKHFWTTLHHASWKHHQLLISAFSWVEKPPGSAYIILFSAFAQVQSAPDVSLLFRLLLTDCTNLGGSLDSCDPWGIRVSGERH